MIDSSPLVRRNAAHCFGSGTRPGVESKMSGADNLHLTDLAAASGRAVALIPAAAATFGLAVGFRVLAAALAGCARAECALTLFRFLRHWNLLFTLSWVLRWVAPTTEVSHRRPQSGLYEAAVFDERIDYLMGGPGTGAAAEALSLDPENGERISANLPCINTEGAMPTI